MTLLEANCLLEELIKAKVILNHLWLTQDSDGNWAFNDDNHLAVPANYEDPSTFTEEFLRMEAAHWIECIT